MKLVTVIPPENSGGANYVILHDGDLFYLSRDGAKGRQNSISMTPADAVTICNQLIDAIEQDK